MSNDHNQRPLKDVIDQFLKIYRHDKKYQLVEVEKAWQKVMGTYISSKTKSLYLSGTVLRVKMESSVIAQEITIEKSKMMGELNAEIGRVVVEEILFVE